MTRDNGASGYNEAIPLADKASRILSRIRGTSGRSVATRKGGIDADPGGCVYRARSNVGKAVPAPSSRMIFGWVELEVVNRQR